MKSSEVVSAYCQAKRFLPDPLPDEVIRGCIETAKAVPAQFHLEPTHYWVISDTKTKEAISTACFGQPLVLQAPTLVVFSASRFVARRSESIIDRELEAGSITVSQAESLERQIGLYFDTSPCMLGWIAKCLAGPLFRLFTPLPQLAAVHKREWLTRQGMRSATLFWYAMQEGGYGSEFIDAFDERRVKKAVGAPWHHVVFAVIAVGYAAEKFPKKSTGMTEEVLHCNS